MRIYINLEKKQIEHILMLFSELDETRGLRAVDKFLRLIFIDALEKASHGM